MNCLVLGYVAVILNVLGENADTFGAMAEVQRKHKKHKDHNSLRQKMLLDTTGSLSTYAPEPEFVGGVTSIKVIAGKDAVLRCNVENLGDKQVMWQFVKDKLLLSMGTQVFIQSGKYQVTTSNSTSWSLLIRNVTLHDIGYYACQISTHPMKTIAGYLSVVEPPEFVTNMTHGNVTVMENSNVTLSCKARGEPTPVIKWMREDRQPFVINGTKTHEYINEEMTFVGVSRDHMAAYLCVASNGVPPAISRRIYLDVKFPPLIWIHNNLVGARENIDVHLECQTVGHPLTENFWLRNDEPIASKSSRYKPSLVRTFFKTHMRLTIRDLQPEDYGSYQCVAKNAIGETQGTIKLFRQYLPAPPSPSFITELRTPLPTRRVITIPSTTERQLFIKDIERVENVHTPGSQQKYGDGRVVPDIDRSSASENSNKISFIFVSSLHMVWTFVLKYR